MPKIGQFLSSYFHYQCSDTKNKVALVFLLLGVLMPKIGQLSSKHELKKNIWYSA